MEKIVTFHFLLVVFGSVHGAKILLVSSSSTSHCLGMMSIGQELLRRGHHVTLYGALLEPQKCTSRYNASAFKSKFKTVIPNLDSSFRKIYDDTMATAQKHVFERTNIFMFILRDLRTMIRSQCHAIHSDKTALEELQKDKYDLAMVDTLSFVSCLFSVPYLLGLPTVAVGSYIDFQDCRAPLQTNIVPNFFTAYSNNMSFFQRLVNTLLSFINPIIRKVLIPTVDLSGHNEKLRGLDTSDLIRASVLFLENSDYIVDYPKALFPNFVQVGGLTAGSANPLPVEIKRFLDKAEGGVILVTYGSVLRFFPDALREKLISAFSRLKAQVLFKQDKEEIRGNVRTMKWIPQNDILGHPNTKLFISHCGKNGFWEGVYHGVPIICTPIHAETYITDVKVKIYGIGSSINIFDDSVDEMVKKINDVLSNSSISQNMKKISKLLRDRPETAAQRGAAAIEHVIKYGGDHMRPPSLGLMSYMCIDVWITIFLCLILIIFFDVWIIRKCCCLTKVDSKRKRE